MNKIKNDKKNISFSFFLTSILIFFFIWVFLSEYIANIYVKNLKKSDINTFNSIEKKDLDLSKFWDTYSLLKEKYYSLEWINKSDLVDWAISWMIESIWDKHSEFMTSSEATIFNDTLNWDFEWIWAVVEKIPLWVMIDRILKWSPAKKYWLKKWDIIIEANNEKLQDLNITQAVNKIKWPSGTKVVLKIIRAWEDELIEKEVFRAKIKIPTVDIDELEWEEIWYISLNMYWENSSKDFKEALFSFKNKKGIVIDLRDNGWWYLISAVEILSNFIEKNEKLVQVKWKELLNNISYSSLNSWEIYSWKIVVIINWNSASASEITAWALKDYNKAILVWTKTYWKWSVQEPFSFSDWSQVKFTTSKWFTPKWVNIDENWIEPDIEIIFQKQDYDFEECIKLGVCEKDLEEKDFVFYDRQLEEAKNILKFFIKYGSRNIAISKFLKENSNYIKN